MKKYLLLLILFLSLTSVLATEGSFGGIDMNVSIVTIVSEVAPGGGGPPKKMRLYDLKIECNDIVFFNTYSICKATIENKGNIWEDILISFQVFDPFNKMFKIIEESILVPPNTATIKEFKTIIPSEPVPTYSIFEENKSETQYAFYPTEGKYIASIILSIPNETLATSKESFFVLSIPDILTESEFIYLIFGVIIVIAGLGFYDYRKKQEIKRRPLYLRKRKK